MSKDANSFGHDKALAWESRGFVYTKRGCIVSTHPLLFYAYDVLLLSKINHVSLAVEAEVVSKRQYL